MIAAHGVFDFGLEARGHSAFLDSIVAIDGLRVLQVRITDSRDALINVSLHDKVQSHGTEHNFCHFGYFSESLQEERLETYL